MIATRDLAIEVAGRPWVPVRVEGHGPYWFLLDTGCLSASLSSSVVRELALPDEDGWVTVRSLAVGDTCWLALGLGHDDCGALGNRLGHRLDGFLGSRLFASSGLVLMLDYPGRTLSLLPRDDVEPFALELPLRVAGGYPLVPVQIHGTGPYWFLLDTGASTSVISTDLASRLSLPRGEARAAHGARDSLEAHSTMISAMAVGPIEQHGLDVAIMDCTGISATAGCQVDGYVGHDFLSHRRVAIDYAGGRLGLR